MKSTDSLLQLILRQLARQSAHASLLHHIRKAAPKVANGNIPPHPRNGQVDVDSDSQVNVINRRDILPARTGPVLLEGNSDGNWILASLPGAYRLDAALSRHSWPVGCDHRDRPCGAPGKLSYNLEQGRVLKALNSASFAGGTLI